MSSRSLRPRVVGSDAGLDCASAGCEDDCDLEWRDDSGSWFVWGSFSPGRHWGSRCGWGSLTRRWCSRRSREVFVLGLRRGRRITHDRVLVSPAAGEAGKMPFWHGDRPGVAEAGLGAQLARWCERCGRMPRNIALTTLTTETRSGSAGCGECVALSGRSRSWRAGRVPDDRNIVIEQVRDQLGFWPICCLTPFGSKVHAPWAMAAVARIVANGGAEVETMWSEDGFCLRFPETEEPPPVEHLLLGPEEAAELVQGQLGSTALFAAKFRESASRALLPPRRRADGPDSAVAAAQAEHRMTCWRGWHRGIPRFRLCWRHTASVCAMCSICRR